MKILGLWIAFVVVVGGGLQEALKLGRKFISIDDSVKAIKLNQQWIKESENCLSSGNVALINKIIIK